MDFFSKVKRAFGFSEDGSDFNDEVDADVRSMPYVNPFRSDKLQPRQQAQAESELMDVRGGDSVSELKDQMRQLMAMMRQLQGQKVQDGQPDGRGDLHSDDGDLKQRLQASEAQRRSAQSRANSMAEKIEQLQVRLTTLENDKKGLLNKIRVMQVKAGGDAGTETTDAIEKMMEQHHEELDAKDKAMTELEERLSLALGDANEMRAEVQQLQARVSERDGQIAKLEEEVREAHANLEIAEDVQKKLEQVEQFKEKKNQEIGHLKDELARLRAESVEDRGKHDEQLAKAQADADKLRATISQLNAQAKDMADRHKRRDIDVANHIDSLKEQLASAATVIERHRVDRERLDEQVQKLMSGHEADEAQLREARASMTVAEAQAEQLREEVVKLNEQLASSLSDAAAAKQSHRDALADKEREILQLRSSASNKDAEIADLNVELESAKERADESRREVERLEQIGESRENEIRILKSQIEELRERGAGGDIKISAMPEGLVADDNQLGYGENVGGSHTDVEVASSVKPVDPFAAIEQDLDDIDWLLPVEPDVPVAAEPEPEPEVQPKPKPDPRQLSLF